MQLKVMREEVGITVIGVFVFFLFHCGMNKPEDQWSCKRSPDIWFK